MGAPCKVKLPSVDTMRHLIKISGRGSYMYAADLSRAYHVLPLEVTDWHLCCIQDGAYYIDISISFGLHWGALACQRTTSVVTHILAKQGHSIINYIDNFGRVASSLQGAQEGFKALQGCSQELGLEENTKASPPIRIMTCLRVEFNTLDMTMSIPPQKLQDTPQLMLDWSHRKTASPTQLKSILGKLFHIAQCCKPARLFLGRMLTTLRACPPPSTARRSSTRTSTGTSSGSHTSCPPPTACS